MSFVNFQRYGMIRLIANGSQPGFFYRSLVHQVGGEQATLVMVGVGMQEVVELLSYELLDSATLVSNSHMCIV
jgi:hypothetical protein